MSDNSHAKASADKSKSLARQKGMLATRYVAYTGVATALVTAATLAGASTPNFYFNLGDSVILMIAALFGPLPAAIAGGLGSFFADLAVYPATMVYTLVIKGLEGLIAGGLLYLISFLHKRRLINNAVKIALSILSLILSAMFMMTGYFVAQTFIYGTYYTAMLALPMDAAQAAISSALASLVLYGARLIQLKEKLIPPLSKTDAEYTSKNTPYLRESERNSDNGDELSDR